jgi:hypothetical protein
MIKVLGSICLCVFVGVGGIAITMFVHNLTERAIDWWNGK